MEANNYSIKNGIVVIGGSSGGFNSIRSVLMKIPSDFSMPIMITLHVASYLYSYDKSIEKLNKKCRITLKTAENGEYLSPGFAYFCPAGNNMEVVLNNEKPAVKLSINDHLYHGMPCIDDLFSSAAKIYKHSTIGVILTGSLRDGVTGLNIIKNARGITIAESKETAEIFGMPKRAIEEGAVHYIVPNYDIKNHIVRFATVNVLHTNF